MSTTQAGLTFRPEEDPKPEDEPLEKIRLEHLIFPFIILGVGTAVAHLVFVCELKRGKSESQLGYTGHWGYCILMLGI